MEANKSAVFFNSFTAKTKFIELHWLNYSSWSSNFGEILNILLFFQLVFRFISFCFGCGSVLITRAGNQKNYIKIYFINWINFHLFWFLVQFDFYLNGFEWKRSEQSNFCRRNGLSVCSIAKHKFYRWFRSLAVTTTIIWWIDRRRFDIFFFLFFFLSFSLSLELISDLMRIVEPSFAINYFFFCIFQSAKWNISKCNWWEDRHTNYL